MLRRSLYRSAGASGGGRRRKDEPPYREHLIVFLLILAGLGLVTLLYGWLKSRG